jgi:hypothetical protein
LEAAMEKQQVIYKIQPIGIIAGLSTKTLKARLAWNEVFQALKENNYKSTLLSKAIIQN